MISSSLNVWVDIYAKHHNSTHNDHLLFMYFSHIFVKLLCLNLTMKDNYFDVNNYTRISFIMLTAKRNVKYKIFGPDILVLVRVVICSIHIYHDSFFSPVFALREPAQVCAIHSIQKAATVRELTRSGA